MLGSATANFHPSAFRPPESALIAATLNLNELMSAWEEPAGTGVYCEGKALVLNVIGKGVDRITVPYFMVFV